MRGTCIIRRKIELLHALKNDNSKEIYYIDFLDEKMGFFAALRVVLDYICYADEQGFIPYIKYGKNTPYTNETPVQGTCNVFEYYFNQPIEKETFSLMEHITVLHSRDEHFRQIERKYEKSNITSYHLKIEYIERMAQIYKKYISLNTYTKKYIDKGIAKLLHKKKTLGVHVRGTDFNKGYNDHPVPITIAEYCHEIERAVSLHAYRQIFLATDDDRCLRELEDKVDIPIIYYKNTVRSQKDKSVVFEKNERKNNNYLLGLEVLRDAYTLVSCDGFLGCLSQVDTFVQIIKRSEGKEFDYMKIIDKGIVRSNRYFI